MGNPVSQQDLFGCGVACAAFVTDQTYEQARTFFAEDKIRNATMYCPDIVDFLAQHGLGYDYAKLSNKVDDQYCDSSRVTGELEFGHLARREMSIVFLPPSDDDPVGHYLTCYAGKYMDPWANRHEKYNLKVRAEFIDKLPRNPNWVIFAK